jgi:hypothetical protein
VERIGKGLTFSAVAVVTFAVTIQEPLVLVAVELLAKGGLDVDPIARVFEPIPAIVGVGIGGSVFTEGDAGCSIVYAVGGTPGGGFRRLCGVGGYCYRVVEVGEFGSQCSFTHGRKEFPLACHGRAVLSFRFFVVFGKESVHCRCDRHNSLL